MLKRHCYGKSDGAVAAYLKGILNKKHRIDRNKELALGFSELEAMEAEGAEVGLKSYSTVLARCGKWKCLSGALMLVEGMRRRGVQPTEVCWEAVVSACSDMDEMEKVLSLLEKASPPQQVTDNMALTIAALLIHEGAKQSALTVLNTTPPSARTTLWHVLHIEAQPNLTSAGHVFDTLPPPVLSQHYLALLKHCAAEGNYQVAKGILTLIKADPSIKVNHLMYHRLLLACLHSTVSSSQLLFSIVNSKLADGLPLTPMDVTIVIQSAARDISDRGCNVEESIALAEAAFHNIALTMDLVPPAVTALLRVYSAAAHKTGPSLDYKAKAQLAMDKHFTSNLRLTAPTHSALEELGTLCGFDHNEVIKLAERAREIGGREAHLIQGYKSVGLA
eukprot:TRINITY_DN7199_c0_g1_i1.p1 TRINITY_DN7199_c0_g1~~TRINITY_DN7199_c0_g1_i1.p1  ORF type:complete len:391 (+),score=108.61 TRINITY_DN7199_c0_g1_i1:52-1224(+)